MNIMAITSYDAFFHVLANEIEASFTQEEKQLASIKKYIQKIDEIKALEILGKAKSEQLLALIVVWRERFLKSYQEHENTKKEPRVAGILGRIIRKYARIEIENASVQANENALAQYVYDAFVENITRLNNVNLNLLVKPIENPAQQAEAAEHTSQDKLAQAMIRVCEFFITERQTAEQKEALFGHINFIVEVLLRIRVGQTNLFEQLKESHPHMILAGALAGLKQELLIYRTERPAHKAGQARREQYNAVQQKISEAIKALSADNNQENINVVTNQQLLTILQLIGNTMNAIRSENDKTNVFFKKTANGSKLLPRLKDMRNILKDCKNHNTIMAMDFISITQLLARDAKKMAAYLNEYSETRHKNEWEDLQRQLSVSLVAFQTAAHQNKDNLFAINEGNIQLNQNLVTPLQVYVLKLKETLNLMDKTSHSEAPGSKLNKYIKKKLSLIGQVLNANPSLKPMFKEYLFLEAKEIFLNRINDTLNKIGSTVEDRNFKEALKVSIEKINKTTLANIDTIEKNFTNDVDRFRGNRRYQRHIDAIERVMTVQAAKINKIQPLANENIFVPAHAAPAP